MDNLESQKMELLALLSIYDERDFIVDETDRTGGRFVVNIRLPNSFKVCFRKKREENEEVSTFEIEYLPPMTVFFHFPDTYPSDTGPAFLLSCNWLTISQISRLCKKLDLLWEKTKDSILFSWIQFLEGEALNFLGIYDSLDVTELLKYERMNSRTIRNDTDIASNVSIHQNLTQSVHDHLNKNIRDISNMVPSIYGGSSDIDTRALNDLASGKFLIQVITIYNKFKKNYIFCDSFHECNVCLLSKKGADFVIFENCEHVYCKECVKSYFEMQICEGNVLQLYCLNDSCSSQPDGSIVKEIVSKEIFEKYDMLLLSRSLDSMADIAYCPRLICQCPVILDSCGRMGFCSACQFAFCPFCKMSYHGIAPCNLKSKDKQRLFDEYQNGDASTKTAMEKKYGKQTIRILVEDFLSESWKKSNSKKCPNCKTSIEKYDGCNKMTCFQCGSFFCWLCMEQLINKNPYTHYNDRNSKCYGQLIPDNVEDDIQPGDFLNFY